MTETSSSAEAMPVPVVLTEPDALRYLHFMNDEARLMLAGTLAMEAPNEVSSAHLYNSLLLRQGKSRETIWSFDTTAEQTINLALIRSGIAKATRHGRSKMLRCNPEDAPKLAGFAGALLDLALEYDNFALYPLLGRAYGKRPELRYRICQALQAAGAPLSLRRLEEGLSNDHAYHFIEIRDQAERLSAHGILQRRGDRRMKGEKYDISPAHRMAVVSLIGRIAALGMPPAAGERSSLDIYGARFRQILDRPADVSELLRRSHVSATDTKPVVIERPPPREVLTEEEAIKYMTHFGNSEIKLLLAGMLALHAPNSLTAKQIACMLLSPHRPSGEDSLALKPKHVLQMVRRCLAPVGVAVISSPEQQSYIHCPPEEAAKVLGFVGALLDISLTYKHIAWYQLLGRQEATSLAARYTTYKEFIMADTPLTSDRLRAGIREAYDKNAMHAQVNRLVTYGILHRSKTGNGRIWQYDIHPGYREPIDDFVRRIAALSIRPWRHGERSALEVYGERARHILGMLSNIQELANRAVAAGSGFRGSESIASGETILWQVEQTFRQLGAATAWEVRNALQAQGGHVYEIRSVQKAVRKLLKARRLVIASGASVPERVFRLAPEEPANTATPSHPTNSC